MAGVLLGPSVLGALAPVIARWTIPQTPVQGYLLEVVGLIGVMLLLILTGFETDLALVRRQARTAMGIAIGGLVVPFASGLALGFWFPGDLLVEPDQRAVFALFLATAMSISAIPVLAKILLDMQMMRRDIGQTMLAAGMIDDITGWTMLGIVATLAAVGRITPTNVLISLLTVAVFVVVTATVGRFIVVRGLAFVQDRMKGRDRLLTLIVVLAFLWAGFTHALRLEPVLGAFAIGILFGQMRRLPSDVSHKLEGAALAIFSPIFFAVAGLKVDITSLANPRLLRLALVVIAVATFGKVVGAYLGARYLSNQDHWTSLAYGAGLNARGAVEIIVASIGLSLGILSQEVFSMVVVMAVVTSLAAPFALRAILRRIEPGADEVARLRREESSHGSLVGSIRRVLVPVRPRQSSLGGAQVIGATIIGRLAITHGIAVTLLSVGSRNDRVAVNEFLDDVEPLFGPNTVVSRRIVESSDPVKAVINEAQHDYDLVVLGATEIDSTSEALFGGVVDEIVRLAPVSSLVVRGETCRRAGGRGGSCCPLTERWHLVAPPSSHSLWSNPTGWSRSSTSFPKRPVRWRRSWPTIPPIALRSAIRSPPTCVSSASPSAYLPKPRFGWVPSRRKQSSRLPDGSTPTWWYWGPRSEPHPRGYFSDRESKGSWPPAPARWWCSTPRKDREFVRRSA